MPRPSLRTFLYLFVATIGPLTLVASGTQSVSYKVLHAFDSRHAGIPLSGLVADTAGNVYGTTAEGGNYGGMGGTVYRLSAITGFSVIHAFGPPPDGLKPEGNLAIDAAGNLYGTTLGGGASEQCSNGCGTVFKLTPPSNGGGWTETVLYSFCSAANCSDGANPTSGVILDSAGNLYGTTEQGGLDGPNGCGTVFELTPNAGSWTETVLYDVIDSCNPESGLTLDASGNLYGTVFTAGQQVAGLVFELSAPQLGGSWVYTTIYAFTGAPGFDRDSSNFCI